MIFATGEKKGKCDPFLATVNDLRDKEVVSVADGKRLGYISDLTVDMRSGRVIALTLPGELRYFGIRRMPDIVIPWSAISKIGDDVILVDPAEILPVEENNCK